MPTISFDRVSKSYQSNRVIEAFDATVPDKDFLVLLGPSGCGKSTMLRMIAGITDVTSGEIRFDDDVVNDKSPRSRNIAFVFQSYALYPHMSVGANIGFPLVMDRFRWWHHVPVLGAVVRRGMLRSPEVSAKVAEVAEMLELSPYLERRPKALSGGQRQRVALARALVREPSVYLLDEPLSNLDAKLRTQMRAEISALHARVGKTFVYVTHDQVEAMTMGTRIIVLDAGVVQQHGTPQEIYDRPANEFVARFIGSPPMNLLDVRATSEGLEAGEVLLPGTRSHAEALRATGTEAVRLGVRAERIALDADHGSEALAARVTSVEHLGSETVVGFRLGAGDREQTPVGAAAVRDAHLAKLQGTHRIEVGDACRVRLDLEGASWFDVESGARLEV